MNKLRRLSRKGQTLGLWFEVILFSLLFVVLFILLVNGFNSSYGQNEDATFGKSTFSNAQDTIDNFGDDIDTLKGQVEEGEFSFLDGIIIIGTIGSMLKTIILSIITFLSGGWIYDIIVGLMGLPSALSVVLRILFIGSIIFILIKLIFRFK